MGGERVNINVKSTLTDRGFRHWEPIPTSYGHEIRVYESSAASAPHIWLAVDGEKAITDFPGTAHLTLDQAKAVRDALDEAITNHYQLRSSTG